MKLPVCDLYRREKGKRAERESEFLVDFSLQCAIKVFPGFDMPARKTPPVGVGPTIRAASAQKNALGPEENRIDDVWHDRLRWTKVQSVFVLGQMRKRQLSLRFDRLDSKIAPNVDHAGKAQQRAG